MTRVVMKSERTKFYLKHTSVYFPFPCVKHDVTSNFPWCCCATVLYDGVWYPGFMYKGPWHEALSCCPFRDIPYVFFLCKFWFRVGVEVWWGDGGCISGPEGNHRPHHHTHLPMLGAFLVKRKQTCYFLAHWINRTLREACIPKCQSACAMGVSTSFYLRQLKVGSIEPLVRLAFQTLRTGRSGHPLNLLKF